MLMAAPWDGELLSSVLARSARYLGKPVRPAHRFFFGTYTVLHPQFPKHVQLFARTPTECLIFPHTHYGLCEPFIEPHLRVRLLDSMRDLSPKGKHGVIGSMLTGMYLENYRFCWNCWEEQRARYHDDMGWLSVWQVPQLRKCPVCGGLLRDTGESFRDCNGVYRNLDWSEVNLSTAVELTAMPHDDLLSTTAATLLKGIPGELPNAIQWKIFWKILLQNRNNDDIAAAGERYWGAQCLEMMQVKRVDRSLLRGTGKRIWWKNLLLLKAANPDIDLVSAIKFAARIKTYNLVYRQFI